ncbi:MAG: hypothetical protein WC734_02205 [Patescibacteria group bacterium]|jgi:hypothetical protein
MPKPKRRAHKKNLSHPPTNLPVVRRSWYARWHDFPAHREIHWLSAIAIAWGAALVILAGIVGLNQDSQPTTTAVRGATVRRVEPVQPMGQVLGEETHRTPTDAPGIPADVRPRSFDVTLPQSLLLLN